VRLANSDSDRGTWSAGSAVHRAPAPRRPPRPAGIGRRDIGRGRNDTDRRWARSSEPHGLNRHADVSFEAAATSSATRGDSRTAAARARLVTGARRLGHPEVMSNDVCRHDVARCGFNVDVSESLPSARMPSITALSGSASAQELGSWRRLARIWMTWIGSSPVRLELLLLGRSVFDASYR